MGTQIQMFIFSLEIVDGRNIIIFLYFNGSSTMRGVERRRSLVFFSLNSTIRALLSIVQKENTLLPFFHCHHCFAFVFDSIFDSKTLLLMMSMY